MAAVAVDAESVDALIHAITGLSCGEDETARSREDIPPYLRIREADIAEKLRVVRTLPALAAAVGPSRAKDKLVPKVSELIDASIDNGEDELLLEVCQQLGEFVPLLGTAASCHCLVEPLGRVLRSVEEVVVSEAAADALIRVVNELPPGLVESGVLPLIKSVFEDDVFCSSRRAACRLVAPCYAKVSGADARGELKSRLLQAASSEDEILLVREAATLQLGPLSLLATKDRQELLACLVSLAADNHRDVRAASVTSLLDIAAACSDKELTASLLPALEKFAEDSHRNTRLNLAKGLPPFQAAFTRLGKSLGPLFIRLWEDNEPEVRRASAKNLAAFADASTREFFNSQLVPKLKEHLVNERDERVRRDTVAETVKLLPNLKKEEAADLVKVVLGLVAEGGTPAAKQAVFDHLADILAVCAPADMKSSVIPSLLKLYNDSNWRVRLGAAKVLPELTSAVDESLVGSTLVPAFVSWLRDPACEIRNTAAAAVGKVASERPALAEAAATSAALAALATDANYQFRKVWVACAAELLQHGPAACHSTLLPQLLPLAADKVPNVRIAVVRALHRVGDRLDPAVVKKDVQPRLAELAKDADPDVRFYAAEAAASLQQ